MKSPNNDSFVFNSFENIGVMKMKRVNKMKKKFELTNIQKLERMGLFVFVIVVAFLIWLLIISLLSDLKRLVEKFKKRRE